VYWCHWQGNSLQSQKCFWILAWKWQQLLRWKQYRVEELCSQHRGILLEQIGNGGNHVNGFQKGSKHKLVKDRCLVAEVVYWE
jgi:hypothetical protein